MMPFVNLEFILLPNVLARAFHKTCSPALVLMPPDHQMPCSKPKDTRDQNRREDVNKKQIGILHIR